MQVMLTFRNQQQVTDSSPVPDDEPIWSALRSNSYQIIIKTGQKRIVNTSKCIAIVKPISLSRFEMINKT